LTKPVVVPNTNPLAKGEPVSTIQNHSEPIAIADRSANVTWQGSLAAGRGTIHSGSGALTGHEVTWAARTEQPEGKTSPEELCAAAHSACFSMALALKLGDHGTPPERLEVEATVALADVDGAPTITSSVLDVTARVADLDQTTFDDIVAQAAELCPVSRLFAGADISVRTRLAGV
jgi:osmotically inducible protein OsmC